ncbi:MAG: efflux RND transporter periplasmic adaptor subunit, partial [Alphaproteobacteria bacterium]
VKEARREVQAVGTLLSNESVLIKPEIAGRIAAINFKEGERVKQGDILVELDKSEWEAQLKQAEASLVLSKANYQRANEMAKTGAGTVRNLDEARSKMLSDEAAVSLAKTKLEKAVMSAPFSGVVGLRKVSMGAYVNAGADIVNLEQIDPLKVDFRVPEGLLAQLRVDQKIVMQVDALPGQDILGNVYAIDPLVDVNGRAIALRARVPNPDARLRPGLFARVTLVLSSRPDAMFVPEASIVPVGDQHMVLSVTGGKIAPRPVKIGIRTKGMVEILEGLTPADVVISAGAGLPKYFPGMSACVMRPIEGVPTCAPPPGMKPPPGAQQTPPPAGDKKPTPAKDQQDPAKARPGTPPAKQSQ